MAKELVFGVTPHIHPYLPQLVTLFLEAEHPHHVACTLDERRAALREQPLDDWVRQIVQLHPDANRDTVRWVLGLRRAAYHAAKDYAALHEASFDLIDKNNQYATEMHTFMHTVNEKLYRMSVGSLMEKTMGPFQMNVRPSLFSEFRLRDVAMEQELRLLEKKKTHSQREKICVMVSTGHISERYSPDLYTRCEDLMPSTVSLADVYMPVILEDMAAADYKESRM